MNKSIFRALNLRELFPKMPIQALEDMSFDEEYMFGLYHINFSIGGCEFGYGMKTGQELVFLNLNVMDRNPLQIRNGNKILGALRLPNMLGETDPSLIESLSLNLKQILVGSAHVTQWKGIIDGLHILIAKVGNETFNFVQINDVDRLVANLLDTDDVDVNEILQS